MLHAPQKLETSGKGTALLKATRLQSDLEFLEKENALLFSDLKSKDQQLETLNAELHRQHQLVDQVGGCGGEGWGKGCVGGRDGEKDVWGGEGQCSESKEPLYKGSGGSGARAAACHRTSPLSPPLLFLPDPPTISPGRPESRAAQPADA
jgi:hypothetical protein